MARVTVKLHGLLDIGDTLSFEVESMEEALEATLRQVKRIKPELFNARTKLKLQVVGYDTDKSLQVAPEDGQVLQIVPAVVVGKNLGGFQVIVGAVLVAASFVPGLQFLLPIGISLVLGGALQLLAPTPTIDTNPDDVNPDASKYIAGSGNTTKHGTRITLAGGRIAWYGQILSINIQARDLSSGGLLNEGVSSGGGGGKGGSSIKYVFGVGGALL